jgi:hypothetical protein
MIRNETYDLCYYERVKRKRNPDNFINVHSMGVFKNAEIAL